MNEVVDSIRRVASIMSEISIASQEQSAGIDQINRAVTQMDKGVQQNAAMVENASAAANALRDEVGHLARAVSAFNIEARSYQVATSALPSGTWRISGQTDQNELV